MEHPATPDEPEILTAYMKARPNALVAVICKYKGDTDRVFEDLKALGVEKLRRHSRDDFVFTPGVIVTNSSQAKGLEFSAVLVFNPSASQYTDDHENRMLMYVVLTRAADHLWIVGHQPMAYGLENWGGVDMLNPEALEHLKVLDLELQRFNMKKKVGTKLMVILVGEACLMLKRADGMESPKPWARMTTSSAE